MVIKHDLDFSLCFYFCVFIIIIILTLIHLYTFITFLFYRAYISHLSFLYCFTLILSTSYSDILLVFQQHHSSITYYLTEFIFSLISKNGKE
ncbi:hypothetical protein BDA99DRAFT_217973 [Phascolomyces articulosus]|uniref:Uncharacterized protein n=1 Tax=Phascolomyces articulosus TaxID=60185 RepID=A0AAD5P923_9FUNG|nr:hypothetical protein BDA99DRAFT_217973 [Phascolomyces articulosus]